MLSKSIPRSFLIVIHIHFYLQAGNSLSFLKETYLNIFASQIGENEGRHNLHKGNANVDA